MLSSTFSSLWTVFALGLISAQEPQRFARQTVAAIQFEPADQPLDKRDLADALKVNVGRPLDLNQVAESIDRLYASGVYQDIKVFAEKGAGGGVTLRFVTVPQRFIGHVQARGSIKEPPTQSVILGEAQLTLGKPFDPEAVETARENIEKELHLNGLFRGTVSTTTINDPITHQVTIGFIVNSGKRARYELPVITGDSKLPDNTIIRATGWRIPLIHRWRQMTKSVTDKGTDGIEKRYAKKGRLTADVDITAVDFDSAKNRAQPHLLLDAGPTISIHAAGTKLSKGRLRKYVPVDEEGALDNDLLAEGARNLRAYFQSRGYPEATVTFKRNPVIADQQAITYQIDAGPRRRLISVKITGNHYFFEDMLRERMFLRPRSLLLRYGRYSDDFVTQDKAALTSLYQTNGFRDVKVESTVSSGGDGKETNLAVTLHVIEGPQWILSKLELRGASEADLAALKQQLVSTEGQPFADISISADRDRVLQYYSSRGFLSASFRFQLTPDESNHSMRLIYFVRPGRQEFVRKILLSGLDLTRPSIVEKTLNNIEPGDPVSTEKMSDLSRRLSDLGVFAGVHAGLQNPDGDSIDKYVLYDFDEANRYTFNLGFGLEVGQFGQTTNSLSEAGGAKGVSPIVSFDVNRLNFLGRAQTLSLQTKYSTLEQRESLNYIIPRAVWSLNRTLTFSALYDTTQDVQTFSSKRAEASVQVSQKINRASNLLVRFAYRRVSVGSLDIPSLLVPQLLQPVRIGILSLSYIQDHRDNSSDAHRGFYNTVDTALAGNFFGSQRSFARILARNATYKTFGPHLTFARQTQFGVIVPFNVASGVASFDAIPLPERFFGGGSVSMRGFGDNQAGPRDIGTVSESGSASSTATGFPIGGSALFFNSLELRFPLLGPNISGVFFHDIGNIYTSLSDVSLAYAQKSRSDFNYAVQAPGFGLRYKTPFGPIRVDFSYALNPPKYFGYSNSLTIQQLLACGTGCPSGPQQLSHFNFFFSIGQAF